MKTTAVALTGAVVLASGAYALGTQSGGGDATAASAKNAAKAKAFARHRFGVRHGADLTSLADKLGVSEDKLKDALQSLRTDKQDELATKLADALGIDASKVKSVLDDLRPQGPPQGGPPPGGPGGPGAPPAGRAHRGGAPAFMADALAKKLGLDADKVRDALQSLTPDDVQQAGGFPEALAKALGVDADKVSDALKSLRPAGPKGGPGGPGGPHGPGPGFGRGGPRGAFFGADLSALASKLGVSEDKLKDAFKKIRDDQRDAFATALAGKLGIDPQKVKDALPDPGSKGP